MLKENISVRSTMDAIVPISRFNRGEANKIFDEVKSKGMKIVLKNNEPTCVLLCPERYDAMVEALEDYALFFEAEKRINSAQTMPSRSEQEVMADLGLSEADLADVEVEIE